MPQISSNFILNSKLSNFERDSYDTKLAMKNVNSQYVDDGHISYCRETNQHYIFKPLSGVDVNNLEYPYEYSETGWWVRLTSDVISNLNSGEIDILEYIIKSNKNIPFVKNLAELRKISEEEASSTPVGWIVYCEDTRLDPEGENLTDYVNPQLYYFTYDNRIADPNNQPSKPEWSDATGWYKPLYDLPDKLYVKHTELEEMGYITLDDLPEIEAGGIIKFETVEDMKNQQISDLEYIQFGQIVFCVENGLHYYCNYDPDVAINDIDPEYGYFKQIVGDFKTNLTGLYDPAVTRKTWVEEPIGNLAGSQLKDLRDMPYDDLFDEIIFKKVTPKFVYPEVSIDMENFDWDDMWKGEWDQKDPKTLIRKIGTKLGQELDGKFILISNRGKVIYNNHPNSDGTFGKETPWAGEVITDHPQGNETASYVYCMVGDKTLSQIPDTVQEGDQKFFYRAYFRSGKDSNIIPINNYAEELEEKAWKHENYVDSANYIVIHGTRPWYLMNKQGVFEEQSLIPWTEEMVAYAQFHPTSQSKQSIKLPRRAKSIHTYNELSGNYAETSLNLYKLTTNGEYDYEYIYDVEQFGHRGALKIKIVF